MILRAVVVVVVVEDGAVMVNVREFLELPPLVPQLTETSAEPALAMLELKTVACKFVLLTYVVIKGLPFQSTTHPIWRFDPFTVRVKAAPPAVALVGEMELNVITLLLVSASATEGIVNKTNIRKKFSFVFIVTPLPSNGIT